MKKVKFYAVQTLKGTEIERFELGAAMQDEYGRISARRYDEFKRAMFKLQSEANRFSGTKNYTFYITNENNEKDTFGGYPAYGFLDYGVKFEKRF